MIFVRLGFLLLILSSLNVYSQTQQQVFESNKPRAYKFDEYGKITTKKLKIRLTNFIRKMLESYSAGDIVTGNVVVYAPNKRVANLRGEAIMKFLRVSGAGFIDFDTSIITFIALKSENEKTEFWIIHRGAEPPTFKEANLF